MSSLTIREHPKYSKAYSPLSGIDYRALKDSIKENGLYYAIVVNQEGFILDGYHRFKACQELKIEPRIEVKEFSDPLLEEQFVLEVNLKRRHLINWEKYLVSKRLAEIEKELAKKRQGTRTDLAKDNIRQPVAEGGKALEIVGKKVGLSAETLRQAAYVEEKATPEEHEKLKNGKTTIKKVFKDLKKKERRENVKPVAIPEKVSVKILNQDFAKADVANSSIDLILTDPPYAKDFLPKFQELGSVAAKVLRPGGWLVAYVGKMYLPTILSCLSKHLDYYWTICIQLPDNHHGMFDFDEGWRPAVVFNKSPRGHTTKKTSDFLVNLAPNKELHEDGQGISPFLELVELFSAPGATIFEPCAGGGTTIEACVQKKRHVIACEIDPEAFAILKKQFLSDE